MTIRKILHFPDSRLRLKAEPVAEVNQEIKDLIADMFETMYADDGVGLAATQIDVQKQVIVMDLVGNGEGKRCFINLEIFEKEGSQTCEEGCLSFPGIYAKVERAEKVRARFLDENGVQQEIEAHELLAVCLQHELDHLNGKVFIDHVSPTKRQRLIERLLKVKKEIL